MNKIGVILDLEGTLISNGEALLGSIKLLEYLMEKNIPFRIITNTVSKSCKELSFAFHNVGIDIPEIYFINPIVTVKGFLSKNHIESFWFVGSNDTKSQLGIDGKYKEIPEYIILCDFENVDCNYELLNRIFSYIHKGSKLLTMSQSKYYLSKSGPKLDTGAFCSMFENITGINSILFGKPSDKIYQEAISQMNIESSKIIAIGDDVLTDIKGGNKMSAYSILVKSGKYKKDDETKIKPNKVVENLLEIIPFLKKINNEKDVL
ncbi:HAD superfamily hydrolase (TIGR01458 family) [Natranaerovirga hydrolytica]|uniref:HAD superfamily hydrolase (TIGR01458 family) n=1 Tax=Natranaerovirga hydrolytica TaxID=680378 RepID=A0A4R1MJ11_9FIRM|nr:HAD hydrolase-like protein [Natranaerovirga hydrolytica]TCK92666.1 HAD superfamily hydrolase (TIGR01458 family) [Natranaerovirga hydrolytica]